VPISFSCFRGRSVYGVALLLPDPLMLAESYALSAVKQCANRRNPPTV
jgi:hypothetical protein